jgi:hypothetical protein
MTCVPVLPQSGRLSFLRPAAPLACAAALVMALAGAYPGLRAAQASTPSVCNIETPERIVAVGDVHGAYDRFVAILRTAGILDNRDRWIGGRTRFVQVGDVLDRGPDSRRALDLLRRLERDAARAGGAVHALLGNHEVMRMVGDWRYVSDGEYAAFRDANSTGRREQVFKASADAEAERMRREGKDYDEVAFREKFLKDVPLGAIEMRQAFGPNGEYGRWLRTHDTIIRINGIVFVHGGIAPSTASMGCEETNATVRREITGPDLRATPFSSSDAGPLWYRGLAEESEGAFAPTLTAILTQMGARAIVIGHTVSIGRMAARFEGRVVQIDTGMLSDFFPGGVASALEIHGETVSAIYADRREVVRLAPRETPALAH